VVKTFQSKHSISVIDACVDVFYQNVLVLSKIPANEIPFNKTNSFAGITAKQKPLNKNKLVCRDDCKVKTFKQK